MIIGRRLFLGTQYNISNQHINFPTTLIRWVILSLSPFAFVTIKGLENLHDSPKRCAYSWIITWHPHEHTHELIIEKYWRITSHKHMKHSFKIVYLLFTAYFLVCTTDIRTLLSLNSGKNMASVIIQTIRQHNRQ